MWIIAGTIPDPDFALLAPERESAAPRAASLSEAGLHLPDGRAVPVERGTAALAATALQTCAALGCPPPALLLAGDTGSGSGSRQLYAWLEKALPGLAPRGLTFHYLFPDVDWHNRLLLAVRELENAPLMVADAGFMYVAKMSGYADAYELFTPDVGELAFLADEKAPHPFYTRGFLLAEEQNIPVLLARAQAHGNCPANLIIKGKADHIIHEGRLHAVVDSPSVPAMECCAPVCPPPRPPWQPRVWPACWPPTAGPIRPRPSAASLPPCPRSCPIAGTGSLLWAGPDPFSQQVRLQGKAVPCGRLFPYPGIVSPLPQRKKSGGRSRSGVSAALVRRPFHAGTVRKRPGRAVMAVERDLASSSRRFPACDAPYVP